MLINAYTYVVYCPGCVYPRRLLGITTVYLHETIRIMNRFYILKNIGPIYN